MMRSLSTTATLALAGLLSLLLIAYVFVGAGRPARDRAPHCTSQDALSEIKGELLRRAAELRGSTDSAFSDVQAYSVLRVQSRVLRRHYPGSDKVSCTGTLVLDLPPGVAASGDRRSLAAPLTYDLNPQATGAARLLALSNADAIVVPLATVSPSNGPANQAPATVPAAPPQGAAGTGAIVQTPPQAAAPIPQPPKPTRLRPSPVTRRSPPPAPVNTRPRQVASSRAAPTSSPPAPPARAVPQRPAPPITPAPAPVAEARPSFSCRNAGTRGEKAVCANPGLASLDREMSAQFRSAVAAARPGQRVMLRNTGRRFLHYRDSCTSEACIRDAYRGRMQEIHDIMAGGW